MKKQTRWFYLCLVALAWLGLHLGKVTDTHAVSAAPATVAANEGCSAGIGNITIQRTSGGNNFVVSWEAPSPCLSGFEVSLTVIKLSGAERTDTKKINGRTLIAAFSFAGDGDLNPIKKARATVKGTGVLAAKSTLTKSLAIGSGTGSSGTPPTQAAPPAPVRLFGSVADAQGRGIANVTVSFAALKLIPRGVTVPASVRTAGRGGWSQEGFPEGVLFRVTPSRAGFTFSPPSVVAEPGNPITFVATAEQAAAPPAQPPQPFSISGTVLRTNQTAIAGALVSFRIVSGGAGVQVPNPVQSNQNGSWSQSGFTPGVTYEASVFKQGFAFSPNAKTFTATVNLSFVGLPK